MTAMDDNTKWKLSKALAGHRRFVDMILVAVVSLAIGTALGVGFTMLYTGARNSSASSDHKLKRNSPYTATQFISFSINTLGGLEDFGECDGRVVDDKGICYLGSANGDIQQDLQRRFEIVQAVLNALVQDVQKQSPDIDHSPDVLKIFMLPEFFLRGPHGAYSAEEMAREEGLIIGLFDQVQRVISHEAFSDFLFVFGTVVAATSPNDPSHPWDHPTDDLDKGDILFFNFAPIFRGGNHAANGSGAYFVPKKYIAKDDFLRRSQGLPDPRASRLNTYDDFTDLDEETMAFLQQERNVSIVQDGLLDIDGVRIGIEVCVDHLLNVLWNSLKSSSGELVDVHLITSAGMTIERGATPLRPGGVAYLTDGAASSAACLRDDYDEYRPEYVCRGNATSEGPTGLRHVPIGGRGYSSYIQLAACLNPDDAPWKQLIEGYYSEHATQGCAYTLKLHGIDVFDEHSFYPPSVEIYPTIDLP